MKTIVLTQKKFSVSVKNTRDLTAFITEIHQMAKALKEEKDKGFQLVEVSLDALNQTINATVTNSNAPSIEHSGEGQSLPQANRFQAPSLPIRPNRDNRDNRDNRNNRDNRDNKR